MYRIKVAVIRVAETMLEKPGTRTQTLGQRVGRELGADQVTWHDVHAIANDFRLLEIFIGRVHPPGLVEPAYVLGRFQSVLKALGPLTYACEVCGTPAISFANGKVHVTARTEICSLCKGGMSRLGPYGFVHEPTVKTWEQTHRECGIKQTFIELLRLFPASPTQLFDALSVSTEIRSFLINNVDAHEPKDEITWNIGHHSFEKDWFSKELFIRLAQAFPDYAGDIRIVSKLLGHHIIFND